MQLKLEYPTMNFTIYRRVGGIIPLESLTLFTGLPGTGKSFSLMKFLNKEGIHPFVFNLDEDPTLQKFKYSGMTSSEEALKAFLRGEVTDLDNEVIVIDTYARLAETFGSGMNSQDDQINLTRLLLNLCKKHHYTIIVIGHPEDYVGKSSIFKDNQTLIRHAAEHLHLDKIMSTGRKLEPILYRFYVNKGRGIGGTFTIDDWMRD